MNRGLLLAAFCGLSVILAAEGGAVGQAVLAVGAPATSAPKVTFSDATSAAGIEFTHVNGASPQKFLAETMGSGAVLLDYDQDGWLDIFLVDGGSFADPAEAARARHRLYRNRADGTFEDRTAVAGIRHRGFGMGACAGDIDNDGWVDLHVTSVGANLLYRNSGNGTFTDISKAAHIGASVWSASCAFADLDRDGDLDLFVTSYVDATATNNPPCVDARPSTRVYCHPLVFNSLASVLYRNDGNGQFTDVSIPAGIAAHKSNSLGVIVTDVDEDGWPDIFVANDGLPNHLFHNTGKGRFEENGLLAGVAVAGDGRPRAGMGTDAGDYDGDGHLDLIVTNLWGETHSLFRNLGGGLFRHATPESGIGPATLPFVGFATTFLDYDNDGLLDIAIVNGDVIDNTAMTRPGSMHAQRRLLFRGVGTRRFVEVGRTVGAAYAIARVGRGVAAGDVDNDGDLDLLISNNGGRAELLVNDGGNAAQSLLVRTSGVVSNRDGVGARLTLTAGSNKMVREIRAGSGYLGQNALAAHFGLGDIARAARLEVRWPSGTVDVLENVNAGQIITVREGHGLADGKPFSRTR
jgi:enediyne biosynthesis protein E4